MPGSRRTEVARLLPIFGARAGMLAAHAGMVPVVPLAGPVAETVRAGAAHGRAADPGRRDCGQARRLRRRRRGADQVRHLDAGAGDGRRADGGDLSRQPGHRRDRAAADHGALCLDPESDRRAGDRAGTDAGGLHAGAARRGADATADRSGGRRGATRRVRAVLAQLRAARRALASDAAAAVLPCSSCIDAITGLAAHPGPSFHPRSAGCHARHDPSAAASARRPAAASTTHRRAVQHRRDERRVLGGQRIMVFPADFLEAEAGDARHRRAAAARRPASGGGWRNRWPW